MMKKIFPKIAAVIFIFFSCSAFPQDQLPISTFVFNEVSYQHRWSSHGQNEFTPQGQDDLNQWQDMITINVLEPVKNGEDLSVFANKALTNYQRGGKILKVDSKPSSADSPAEHLVVAVLGNPNFLEAAFARFLFKDGVGFVIVRSHRIYGQNISPEMNNWLRSNGPSMESILMSWASLPPLASLKLLPQSAKSVPDMAALIKQRHDLTHLVLRKDTTFGKSIQELIPKGVARIPMETFSTSNWSSAVTIGKSQISDIKMAFGEPTGVTTERDGRLVYSYDAQQLIITYLFNREGVLEASYGYAIPW